MEGGQSAMFVLRAGVGKVFNRISCGDTWGIAMSQAIRATPNETCFEGRPRATPAVSGVPFTAVNEWFITVNCLPGRKENKGKLRI